MTIPTTTTRTYPRRRLRSAGAVLFGFVAVVVLSLGTDQMLHVLMVNPPWGQPMYDPRLSLFALSYGIRDTLSGSYLTAKYALDAPMGHAMALGVVGLIVGGAGAIAPIPMPLVPA